MVQPWIHRSKTDSIFILAPSFVVVIVVFLFQKWIVTIEENYSFYTWLFLIVFIDVAHVYATLFKTYFVKSEFKRKKKLLVGLPILCFIIGMILFSFGSNVFWSVLAYVAVFHFIRQQYGFMRLYSRFENKKFYLLDNLIIYTATIYPMLHWFLSSKRNFNWFVKNEFFYFENPILLKFLTLIYFSIVVLYIITTIYLYIKTKYFNIPKNGIIIGTILSWYFGIVYFNDDLIFTLLNVVSHGIPYMALIYLNEIDKKPDEELGVLNKLKHFKGVLFFVLILLIIAFSEEYLWEILVWKEQFTISNFQYLNWQILWVPLLTIPQFTHYLLDGFIWKSKQ